MIQLRAQSLHGDTTVLHSQGLHATLHLLELLWNDKSKYEKATVDYSMSGTITITTKSHKYTFENVPMYWDGTINTSDIYQRHIHELKDKEVI